MSSAASKGIRIIEVVVVVMVLAGLATVLMPSLRHAKYQAIKQSLERADWPPAARPVREPANAQTSAPPPALAHVKTFKASVGLTPRISIGTATPESIYAASFAADIQAAGPGAAPGDCEIHLPLPPQIISLSDLQITADGEPSEDVSLRDGSLVWRGRFAPDVPREITVKYEAVGKGIYTLRTPPGKIIDTFEATLTANNTNLELLELSLQPDPPVREAGNTTYNWKYDRLMIGRPIAVDILGIAPMDKLGELGWLGPISIVIFGILTALLTMAYRPDKLNKWMLLLIVGTFTGAYPLMYFAQEFLSLRVAVAGAAVLVLAIIGVRAVTLLGVRLGAAGVVVLAAAIFALTLWAATEPAMQGMVLTAMAIGTFVTAMILLPKAQRSLAALPPAAAPPPAGPGEGQDPPSD